MRLLFELVALAFAGSLLVAAGLTGIAMVVGLVGVVGGMVHGRNTDASASR